MPCVFKPPKFTRTSVLYVAVKPSMCFSETPNMQDRPPVQG